MDFLAFSYIPVLIEYGLCMCSEFMAGVWALSEVEARSFATFRCADVIIYSHLKLFHDWDWLLLRRIRHEFANAVVGACWTAECYLEVHCSHLWMKKWQSVSYEVRAQQSSKRTRRLRLKGVGALWLSHWNAEKRKKRKLKRQDLWMLEVRIRCPNTPEDI